MAALQLPATGMAPGSSLRRAANISHKKSTSPNITTISHNPNGNHAAEDDALADFREVCGGSSIILRPPLSRVR